MTAGRTAVVLVAHGERGGTGANAGTHRLAEALATGGDGRAVSAGFLNAEPRFEEVLYAALAQGAGEAIIVPLLMAEGHFARRLRQRLTPRDRILLMRPIGCAPEIQRLACARARHVAAERGWARPSVAVVGHGTSKNPRSRQTTEAVAARMARDPALGAVRSALLEEEPGLAAVLATLPRPVVVVPYLWGAGRHSVDDLRAAVDAAGGDIALDSPVGGDPGVAQAIRRALSRTRRGDWGSGAGPSPRPHAQRS